MARTEKSYLERGVADKQKHLHRGLRGSLAGLSAMRMRDILSCVTSLWSLGGIWPRLLILAVLRSIGLCKRPHHGADPFRRLARRQARQDWPLCSSGASSTCSRLHGILGSSRGGNRSIECMKRPRTTRTRRTIPQIKLATSRPSLPKRPRVARQRLEYPRDCTAKCVGPAFEEPPEDESDEQQDGRPTGELQQFLDARLHALGAIDRCPDHRNDGGSE